MAPCDEPTDWTAIIGVAIIGSIIFAHLIWCLRTGVFVARLVRVERVREPISYWLFIGLQALVVFILYGGALIMLT